VGDNMKKSLDISEEYYLDLQRAVFERKLPKGWSVTTWVKNVCFFLEDIKPGVPEQVLIAVTNDNLKTILLTMFNMRYTVDIVERGVGFLEISHYKTFQEALDALIEACKAGG